MSLAISLDTPVGVSLQPAPVGAAPDPRVRGSGAVQPPGPQAAAVIDDRASWEEFSRPLADAPGCWESYLALEGMHCAACTLNVEDALRGLPGVRSVEVNGTTQTARVTWREDQARPSQWAAALARAGYGMLPASDLFDAQPRRRAQRVMLWRWLVAGFCMMQTMMYAVPMYVAAPGEITPDIAALLRWAAWMMTLPVILFSCGPFFTGAWRDVRARRVGMDVPVALGLAIAFVASTAATLDPTGPWGREVWYDSVTMFVFFLLSGRLLEQRLRDRTAGSLEALLRRLPASVERLDGSGAWSRVPVRRLAVGDIIRVLPGEVFPADGRVQGGASRVDEALLTGESQPLARGPGDAVIAGSHNLAGALTVRVQRLGADTRYAGIVALMERASVDKPELARIADRIATPFLGAVLIAAAVAAIAWWPAGAAHAMSVAVAVLIVTCPCALSLATPAATLAAAGALARGGVLVRNLRGLETAAAVDTVVFDKTGTLTQGGMRVADVVVRAGVSREQALALAAALASHSLHPVSRAIVAAGKGLPLAPVDGVREHAGAGLEAGPLRLGSAAFCAAAGPGSDAGPAVHLRDARGWMASFFLAENVRPDAAQAIARLRAHGLDVQLLSGDRASAVERLARHVGIATARAGCTPQDKLSHVQALQARGHRVLMVGDGMNDAPVLARADVSVAMGEGVALAQSKADFVAQGGRLSAIGGLVRHARRARAVVRQNIAWAALYNAACVPLAIAGWMPPWLAGLGMATSSLVVVANAARLARRPADLTPA